MNQFSRIIIVCFLLASCEPTEKKVPIYTVSFQGGTTVKPQRVRRGEKARRPVAIIKPNQYFAWYKETAQQNEFDFEEERITANITLYGGKWKASKGRAFQTPYSLTYHEQYFYVVDSGGQIVRVEPRTGNRQIFSAKGDGKGEDFQNIVAITVHQDSLYVSDSGISGIWRVNPHNGNREIFSQNGDGKGPDFKVKNGLTIDQVHSLSSGGEDLYVSARASAVYKVTADGQRRIFSAAHIPKRHPLFSKYSAVGSGPSIIEPAGLTYREGFFYVLSSQAGSGAIVKIQSDGNRQEFLNETKSQNIQLIKPIGIIHANGYFYVTTQQGAHGVFRIDAKSGAATLLSNSGTGTGPTSGNGFTGLIYHTGLPKPYRESLYVIDTALQAVLAIDPKTGNRVIWSK